MERNDAVECGRGRGARRRERGRGRANNSANVEPGPSGSGGVRVRGGSRGGGRGRERITSAMIDEIPEGRPLEKAQTIKQKRLLSTVSKPSRDVMSLWSSLMLLPNPPPPPQEEAAVPPSELLSASPPQREELDASMNESVPSPTMLSASPLQREELDASLKESVPSAAMYLECGGSGSSTPRGNEASRKRISQSQSSQLQAGDDAPLAKRSLIPSSSTSSRTLREDEISYRVNYGSEEDTDDDVDGDEIGPLNDREISRVARAYMGLDDDEVNDSEIDTTVAPELRREPFSDIDCGPTVPIASPYDAFTAIWDRSIMEYIADETNAYAQQVASIMLNDGTIRPSSRITKWHDTDADELYIYFAIIMATGVVIKNRLEEYWNSTRDIFSTPGFSAAMRINRFLLLSKCLHFQDNTACDPERMTHAQAKLFKVQPIIDHLNNKFSQLYRLSQNVALDESLTMWKGWLDINQFIRNKAAAVGIKTYEVCESQTGYLWRFEVHAGHDTNAEPHVDGPLSGIVPALVLRLLHGLEHKGHTIFMDNFYNSPALAREMKVLGFDCVGTLRTDRQFVPVELKNLKKTDMAVGQVCGCTSGDVDLVVWRHKNCVAFLSTYHGLQTVMCGDTRKPTVVPDYNVCMGGVDRKDQMLAMYPIERRRNRIWYKKFFRRLLNASILNAFILYRHDHVETHTHRSFRRTLITDLQARHGKRALPALVTPSGAVGHFPGQYGFNPEKTKREHIRRTCAVCKKRTNAYCMACNVPLCVFTCFQPYHSQK